MEDRDNFYEKLKVQLDDTTTFPSDYLYKFIVAVAGDKVAQVQEIFHDKGASITIKKSKTGKYTSISISVRMKNPENIIQKYQELSSIEGIISL